MKSGLILALGLYLVWCLILFVFQRQMMFPRNLVETPASIPNLPGLERLWLKTSYGKVEAWYLPPDSGQNSDPAPLVIFSHGNAELIDYWPEAFSRFAEWGVGLLLVEFPGYGRSEGSPSEKSISEAFIKGYDQMVSRPDIDPSRIILFGRSIGGGAICRLAANRPSHSMILMSTFVSARSFASQYLAPGFLMLDPFDNIKVVQNYPGNLLVIHGKHDEVIPYSHALRLHRTAGKGKLVTYSSGHNDCPPDWNLFWDDLKTFFTETGVLSTSVSDPDHQAAISPVDEF
jgi:pimeloyl-ACP methyl ester carboxylesterase